MSEGWTFETLYRYLEARFEGVDRAHQVADAEREKAAQALASSLRLQIESGDHSLRLHIDTERRALGIADSEREKSATTLAEALKGQIEAGDHALRLHIDSQREAMAAVRQFASQENAASEKAITKAEAANEKRFEQVASFREQLGEANKGLLPREIFDQALVESRTRQDQAAQRVEHLANRITEVEARTSEGRDKTADAKATIAIIASSLIGAVAVAVAVFAR